MDLFSQVFGGAFGGGFEEFFGGGGSRRKGSGKQRGSDLRYDLEISLEEAARGVEKELEIERYVPCETCASKGTKGSGGVKVCSYLRRPRRGRPPSRHFHPAIDLPRMPRRGRNHLRPLQQLAKAKAASSATAASNCASPRASIPAPACVPRGNGDAGVRGGSAGDLYVFLHVRDHDVFERDDADLFCEVPLPFSVAALGGELKVPSLDGQSSIKIPAGTQGGTVFRLRDKGMPALNNARRGDLNVRVQVEVPTKLNHDQQEKLRAFSESIGEHNSPDAGRIFPKGQTLLRSVTKS